ncbi:MAG TPA: XrtB/PEP-CTERM-associated polysaccharide biosynthesis outer membrane protein EpsL, partial [Anaerolineae bacterium]|nr:XrtB/PEP-CTERM-associated polysaccharide biosynthesis outer membrane protein EpsL [Anaerolineae bacterium]
KPGRQRVLASAAKSQVRYSHYGVYDNDPYEYRLKWDWKLGSHWQGEIGATQSEEQSSFENFDVPIKNQITRDNRFASAEWQFHPRWHVGLRAAAFESENSSLLRAPLDHEFTSVAATLGYTTPMRNEVRGQLRRMEGEYPNDPIRPYTQTEYNLLGDWNVTGKLAARGRIGYVQRENDVLTERDFSGLTGRLSADYLASGKTTLTAAIYREIENAYESFASYLINTGGSLGAEWTASAKLTVRADVSFENRVYEGGFVTLIGPQRDDDTLAGSLSLTYAPVPMATFDLGVQAGRRDSNIDVASYTFHAVFVSVRMDF